ncbi:Microtubule-associated protein RP/EB family member 1 [Smittium culicis]|uniref:Microtubule-associated protein RP/EB family member 1 n=1 Tax=Smittium culicis TaxID=133412 RepID=A0A1R1YIA6_9FUNG|nr:Microtubule-associated protein RP/EB family member 1 [Smittium culicis]
MHNYKILQHSFSAHKIDKPISPDRLMKLKFQDNFEFLQWLKGFYDAESTGEFYDANARRNGQSLDSTPSTAPRAASSYSSARSSAVNPSRQVHTRHATSGATTPGRAGSSLSRGSAPVNVSSAALIEANKQISELKNLLTTSEKEREYYYTKLRLVESIIQNTEAEEGSEVYALLAQIQKCLYEEDVYLEENADATENQYLEAYSDMSNLKIDEEETF